MVRFTDVGRFDPLPSFRFLLQMGGRTLGTFMEVSGLKMETEMADYREGGEPGIIRQVPMLTKSNDITLKRGLSQDSELFLWFSQIFSVVGVTDILPDPLFRRTITLLIQDRGGLVLKSYMILRCCCKSYTPGDFNALSNEVAIEEVVLANEGFIETPAGGFAFSTPRII